MLLPFPGSSIHCTLLAASPRFRNGDAHPLLAILRGRRDAYVHKGLLLGLYCIARILAAAAVALVLGAWAVAQYPYLIVP